MCAMLDFSTALAIRESRQAELSHGLGSFLRDGCFEGGNGGHNRKVRGSIAATARQYLWARRE